MVEQAKGFMPTQHVVQVAGTAIYPHLAEGTAPLALRLNVEHNHVLHKRVIIVSARTADVPHIPWERRITVEHLKDRHDGVVHVAADFGFQDRTDIPEALRQAGIDDLDGDAAPFKTRRTSYPRYRCAPPATGP